MINLVNILKHCPEGTKLYSPIFGEVKFLTVFKDKYIDTYTSDNNILRFQKDGRFDSGGECKVLKVVHTSIGCPEIWLDIIKNKIL